MDRRKFLKTSMAAGLGLTCAPGALFAATTPIPTNTVLLTLNLEGGPDFRHVFVPPYDPSNAYSNAFWQARAFAHDLEPEDLAGLESRANEYVAPEDAQYQHFRVNPNCGWLLDMFNQGHVAIINNVYGSSNRDHELSTLILESGNTEATTLEREQSGWGGRLVHQCNRNIVSVTNPLRLVCYGPHPTDPLSHDNARVISAENSRKMGLYEFDSYDESWWQTSRQGQMSRALSSYYAAKAEALPESSPYRQIIQREQSQRQYGRVMKESLFARLVGDTLEDLPLPPEIAGLYTSASINELSDPSFGKQIANIYDVMHARHSLDTNMISAVYTGWDHHRLIRSSIEPALNDIFGTGRGLDTLFTQLGPLADNLVILVYGEFGRQLVANRDNGIDHGVGNSMLVIGKPVQGGVYGDLFPESEVTENRFAETSADITGLTNFKQVIGTLCEKMSAGSGEAVVPGWSGTDLESGVNLGDLFG
jgi:uncharacterized protein (DUF1501 family)